MVTRAQNNHVSYQGQDDKLKIEIGKLIENIWSSNEVFTSSTVFMSNQELTIYITFTMILVQHIVFVSRIN